MKTKLTAIAAAFAALAAIPASSAPITFNFTGNVDFTQLAGQFPIGQAVSGSFTVESTTPDLNPSVLTGVFTAPTTAGHFTLGGFTANFSASGSFGNFAEIENQATPDRVFLQFDVTGPQPIPGVTPALFFVDLTDTDATALITDQLPLTPPDISLFEVRRVALRFLSGTDFLTVTANLTSLALAPQAVPEPNTLALLALALVGLGALRGRQS